MVMYDLKRGALGASKNRPSVLKNYIAELYEEEKHRKSPSNEHC